MASVVISLNANYKGIAINSATYSGACNPQPACAWDPLHDGNGDSSSSGTALGGWSEGTSFDNTIWRGFLAFDTSVLGADAVVTAATITWAGIGNNEIWKNFSLDYTFGSADQGSSIVDSDYENNKTTNKYGTWTNPNADTGSGTRSAGDTTTLNSAGRAYINITGITKFSWKTLWDQDDIAHNDPDSHNRIQIDTATLNITYDNPSMIYSEVITLAETFVKVQELGRMLLETITIIQPLLIKLNGVIIKGFLETIKLVQTYTSAATLKRAYSETMSLVGAIRKFLNGKMTDRWTIVRKTAIITWTKVVKNVSIWYKQPRG